MPFWVATAALRLWPGHIPKSGQHAAQRSNRHLLLRKLSCLACAASVLASFRRRGRDEPKSERRSARKRVCCVHVRLAVMGVSASTLNQLITEEFTRLAEGKSYLTLDEVLQFRVSIGLNIDVESLAVLFDLDRCASLAQLHEKRGAIHLWRNTKVRRLSFARLASHADAARSCDCTGCRRNSRCLLHSVDRHDADIVSI